VDRVVQLVVDLLWIYVMKRDQTSRTD